MWEEGKEEEEVVGGGDMRESEKERRGNMAQGEKRDKVSRFPHIQRNFLQVRCCVQGRIGGGFVYERLRDRV